MHSQAIPTSSSHTDTTPATESIQSLSGGIELDGLYLRILLGEIADKLCALEEGGERISPSTIAVINAINCFVACAGDRVDDVLAKAVKLLVVSRSEPSRA